MVGVWHYSLVCGLEEGIDTSLYNYEYNNNNNKDDDIDIQINDDQKPCQIQINNQYCITCTTYTTKKFCLGEQHVHTTTTSTTSLEEEQHQLVI